jgi:septal ring factor EnvC (AmiA/AmiB activator)
MQTMKSIYISTCCVLSVIAAGAVIFSVHSANQNVNLRNQWQAESKASKAKLTELADVVESGKESITTLENKVSKLSGDLNKNEGELSAANEKIQAYALAEQNRVADERKKYLESVPQPTFDGKIYFFPKVVGAHGETLATNAAFAYITGRRLVFRPENQSAIAVDVDNVHPLILQYLGIDAAAAKSKQQQTDAAWAAKSQAERAQATLDYQAEEAKRMADAKLAIEKQKADAAQQAALAAQQQAQADKEKADAMMINATQPPQPINVIQQNQQIQVQQSPSWHLQNGRWYWY